MPIFKTGWVTYEFRKSQKGQNWKVNSHGTNRNFLEAQQIQRLAKKEPSHQPRMSYGPIEKRFFWLENWQPWRRRRRGGPKVQFTRTINCRVRPGGLSKLCPRPLSRFLVLANLNAEMETTHSAFSSKKRAVPSEIIAEKLLRESGPTLKIGLLLRPFQTSESRYFSSPFNGHKTVSFPETPTQTKGFQSVPRCQSAIAFSKSPAHLFSHFGSRHRQFYVEKKVLDLRL